MSARRFTIRRFRFRRESFSSSVQRLNTMRSALVIFSIINWPMFLAYRSKVSAWTKVMIWYSTQLAGSTSRYSRSICHMPLYSMRTCLGRYFFSSSFI